MLLFFLSCLSTIDRRGTSLDVYSYGNVLGNVVSTDLQITILRACSVVPRRRHEALTTGISQIKSLFSRCPYMYTVFTALPPLRVNAVEADICI